MQRLYMKLTRAFGRANLSPFVDDICHRDGVGPSASIEAENELLVPVRPTWRGSKCGAGNLVEPLGISSTERRPKVCAALQYIKRLEFRTILSDEAEPLLRRRFRLWRGGIFGLARPRLKLRRACLTKRGNPVH